MKKIIVLLFVAAAVLSCKQFDYDIFSTIDGLVVDSDSNPLENVTVTISPGGYNTVTGIDGAFSFEDLDNNKYTVTAQKTGYSTDRKEIKTSAGETINITLILKK